MVEATTPEEHIRMFIERAAEVRDSSEARRLVKDVHSGMMIWETLLKSSQDKLSELDAQLLTIGESLAEEFKRTLRSQGLEKVQAAQANLVDYRERMEAFAIFIDDKFGLDEESDSLDNPSVQSSVDGFGNVDEADQDHQSEHSGESHSHQPARESNISQEVPRENEVSAKESKS